MHLQSFNFHVFMPYFRGIFHQLRNPRLLGNREIGVKGVWDGEKN